MDLTEFVSRLQKAFDEHGNPSDLPGIAETLVNHVLENRTERFGEVFSLIEHHLIYGEDDLRNSILVDLLENLKNFSTWRDLDYVIFENWLGPETHVAWRWLEKRWQGKESLAEAARKLADPETIP